VLTEDILEKFKPQATLCTNKGHTAEAILWFFNKWPGHCPDDPIVIGPDTLLAQTLSVSKSGSVRMAAWYDNTKPTFSDAIEAVRRVVRSCQAFSTSGPRNDLMKILKTLLERLTNTLCNSI
jgi:hypothetical protein